MRQRRSGYETLFWRNEVVAVVRTTLGMVLRKLSMKRSRFEGSVRGFINADVSSSALNRTRLDDICAFVRAKIVY